MSFVESNLLDGEEVVYRARLHWCVFIGPAVLFLIALILFFTTERILYGFGGYGMQNIREFVNPIRIIILLAAVIYLVFVIINYKTTEIFVTNKRISRKRGIISRITLDIKLSMVEAVVFSQGIIGRIFDYGSVYFTGVGALVSRFRGIYKPLEFRNAIIEQINQKNTLKISRIQP
jgi:uncharacterized membrane protein YdbT with pleckstrin-like domain